MPNHFAFFEGADGSPVLVNLNNVTTIHELGDFCLIYFVGESEVPTKVKATVVGIFESLRK